MVNPASSVRKASKLIYSKHSRVKKMFPFLTETHLFASLVVSKTFLFVREVTLPTSAINICVIFSMFYAFVKNLGKSEFNKPVWELSFQRDNFRNDSSGASISGKLHTCDVK